MANDTMNRQSADALIARLESAEVGSRELDAEVARAVGWRPTKMSESIDFAYFWFDPEGRGKLIPSYTTGIDAALSIEVEDANCHGYSVSPAEAEAHVSRNNVSNGHWLFEGHHKTSVPLAICIARLKALRARRGNGE